MSMPDIQIEADTATLCCGKKNCPQLRLDGDDVILRDDHGGRVRISQAQAIAIAEAVVQLRAAAGS